MNTSGTKNPQNPSPRKKTAKITAAAVILLAGILLLLFFWFQGGRDLWVDYWDLRREALDLRERAEVAREHLEGWEALQEERNALLEERDNLDYTLVTEEELRQAFLFLDHLLNQSELELTSMELLPPEQGEEKSGDHDRTAKELLLSVAGTRENQLLFLKETEELPFLVTLQELHWEGSAGEGRMDLDLKLFLVEGEPFKPLELDLPPPTLPNDLEDPVEDFEEGPGADDERDRGDTETPLPLPREEQEQYELPPAEQDREPDLPGQNKPTEYQLRNFSHWRELSGLTDRYPAQLPRPPAPFYSSR